MPIASLGEYSESHWSDVYGIIKEAVELTGYEARLVSESKDSTVIPKSIIQNLYDDDIVICDVSGKNPNVMFELGMRLAFDKPVVLIKDNITGYSFDTSSIEHLTYPRDLRYSEIQKFKQKLAEKITATYNASTEEGYRSFLSNFATIKVATIEQKTLNESEVLENILNKLDKLDSNIKQQNQNTNSSALWKPTIIFEDEIFNDSIEEFQKLQNKAEFLFGEKIKIFQKVKDTRKQIMHLIITSSTPISENMKNEIIDKLQPELAQIAGLPF